MLKTTNLWVLFLLCGFSPFNHLKGQDPVLDLSPIDSLSESAQFLGWLQLFDGKTLYGWKPVAETDWHVENGAIVATQGSKGLLRTTSQFDDFQLCFEFRCDDKANSGVFLRTSPKPRDPTHDCYEFNIAPAINPFPTGSLVGRKKSAAEIQPREQQWHQVHIIANGNTINATIDQKEVISYVDTKHLGRGYIGLQFNQGKIEFRNIFLRPLNLSQLLDKDLSKWNTDLAMDSKFSIDADNVMNVSGGRGQIETREAFADFAFSMNCKTNAVGLNSGVFFRCIPGDLMNGYESQIQNEFLNQDRSNPKDCGTGGIFRRTKAKRIVAEDEVWFTKTIIANGPHISVWVNGQQVTDWSDTRAPDENPRQGRRLKAGTIILQGHDPTTDIDFAQLKVRTLTERWNQTP